MCCSIRRQAAADFAQTSIYVGETFKGKDLVHVLAYSNTVRAITPGPNVMYIHVPSKVPLQEENFVDTTRSPGFFKLMSQAVFPPRISRSLSFRGAIGSAVPKGSVVVTKVGSYYVVACEYPTDAINALKQVPPEYRPAPGQVNEETLEFYEQGFPKWSGVLACFNNSQAIKSDPFMLWYHPLDDTRFRAPMLDEHQGRVPNMRSYVERDHEIFFGSSRLQGGVSWGKNLIEPSISQFLSDRVIGTRIKEETINGDFEAQGLHLLSGDSEAFSQVGLVRG